MPSNARQSATAALFLLAGGAIGAGLGLLYAPRSGRKTRKKVIRYGRQLRNDTEKLAHQASESVADFIDDIGDQTGHLIKRGENVADDLRKDLLRSLDSAQKALDDQRKRLNRYWG